MAKFEINAPEMSADTMADELERIAGMLRSGFTSGETIGGWWSTEDLADDKARCSECDTILTAYEEGKCQSCDGCEEDVDAIIAEGERRADSFYDRDPDGYQAGSF